ncbi:MAG: hypothetical protein IT208_15120 [Chthonomonadales bacterium]|nr:hypothetical protein [Chthonomonadales bacterium]
MRTAAAVLALATLVALAPPAVAAPPLALSLRAGYYRGSGLGTPEGGGRLEGLALGVDATLPQPIPLTPRLGVSASVALGGATRSGGDTDGNLYRLLAFAEQPLGPSGLYAGFGIGIGHAEPRAGGFRATTAVVTRYSVGMPLGPLGALAGARAELGYHSGPDGRLTGWEIDIRFRL